MSIYEEKNIEREINFFKNAESKVSQIEGGSDVVKTLKEENEKTNFITKLSDQKGTPIWDKIIINKSITQNKNGKYENEQRILIPLTEDDIFMSSYVVVAIDENDQVIKLENFTNKRLYQFIHNPSISKEIRETVLINIIFANNKTFGFKKFINIPAELFPDVPLDEGKNTKTIRLSDSVTEKNEMALICIHHLILQCGDCDHYVETTECAYIYVGSTGGGDGDGGYGGGTGTGTGGGGGNTGGGSTPNNTPWYLMNPDIDIYSYPGNVKGTFKSLTDFNIVLQKEHLDFLADNFDLTQTIRNKCLSTNTGYKSTFVYSLLDDYAYANPQQDVTELNNKLTALYNKLFAINPKSNWLEFLDIFSPYEITNPALLSELSNDWSNPDIVKPTVRFKKHAKINGIYNQAKTAANFNLYLKQFIPEASVAHLMFDIGNVDDNSWLAQTSPPQNYWIKTTFNSNKD